jgi:thiamine biosynthesis lipoprotein
MKTGRETSLFSDFEVSMLKRTFSMFIAALLAFQCLLLSSCGKTKEKYSAYSFDFFDTVTTVTGFAESKEEFDEVSAYVLEELGLYHRLFDIYKRYDGIENLCTVNELVDGAHRTVKVDARIIVMLEYAVDMYKITGGKVNIAMGSVLSIWHEYRSEGIDEPWAAKLPPMDKLMAAAEHTDISSLVIDRENSTVTITDPEVRLDVGAIAKGFAVEMVARELEKRGITGYVINVGGNVRTVGAKADGEPWTVGVENPMDDESKPYIAYLGLTGQSLVTSGSYQRYYVVDGKRYHHIIDPKTLMPSEGFLSVSILCESSAMGDALSTALFCMDLETGKVLIEIIEDAEAMWVLPDGTTERTSGFPA